MRHSHRSGQILRNTAIAISWVILFLVPGLILTNDPALAASPPDTSFSYYMNTVNTTTTFNLGYSIGQLVEQGSWPQNTLIILDFGQPDQSGDWGTDLFDQQSSFASIPSITQAVEYFGWGYYNGTGSQNNSTLEMAVGTSNHGSYVGNNTNAYNHGWHWATLVSNCNSFMHDNGYSRQVQCWGGIDSETEWQGPTPTQQWADGYDANGSSPYIDYGDAGGCPEPSPSGHFVSGSGCNGNWGVPGVYQMSYGSNLALPNPQIYDPQGNDADEWANVQAYSSNVKNSSMYFEGSLAQKQACADLGESCSGTDIGASTAWTELDTALNCGACQSPKSPPYATGIRYKLKATT